MTKKIIKSMEEWKRILPPDVFAITRGNGTEPAFQNAYWDNKKPGLYLCSNCQLVLFSSKHKFDSGTGWPSFWKPYHKDNVVFHIDRSFGMLRKEARCFRCDSHLGHVFDDLSDTWRATAEDPAPKGLRYCMNSAALIFKPK
jgi:peptide-methionine (R)-S-oxide reductase